MVGNVCPDHVAQKQQHTQRPWHMAGASHPVDLQAWGREPVWPVAHAGIVSTASWFRDADIPVPGRGLQAAQRLLLLLLLLLLLFGHILPASRFMPFGPRTLPPGSCTPGP